MCKFVYIHHRYMHEKKKYLVINIHCLYVCGSKAWYDDSQPHETRTTYEKNERKRIMK